MKKFKRKPIGAAGQANPSPKPSGVAGASKSPAPLEKPATEPARHEETDGQAPAKEQETAGSTLDLVLEAVTMLNTAGNTMEEVVDMFVGYLSSTQDSIKQVVRHPDGCLNECLAVTGQVSSALPKVVEAWQQAIADITQCYSPRADNKK